MGAPREQRDWKGSTFFRATPEQIKALRMLTLLLICIIFWPTIQWVASAIVRRNPVHTDQVEAVHPSPLDSGVDDGSIVQAWIPCLTIFLLITSFIHIDPSRGAFGGQRRCLAKASRVGIARKGVFDPSEVLLQIPHWEYSMHRVHEPEKTGSRRFCIVSIRVRFRSYVRGGKFGASKRFLFDSGVRKSGKKKVKSSLAEAILRM